LFETLSSNLNFILEPNNVDIDQARIVKKPEMASKSPKSYKDVSQLTSNLKIFDKNSAKKKHNFVMTAE